MAFAKNYRNQQYLWQRTFLALLLVTSAIPLSVRAQSTPNQVVAADPGQTPNPSSSTAPVTLTLRDALERAKKLNPDYRNAVTAARLATEDRVQSRAATLPTASVNGQYLYTQ